MGSKLLAEDAPAEFQAAIDIRRARMHKIRPLAGSESLVVPTTTEVEARHAGAASRIEEAPDFPDESTSIVESDPRSLTPADRIARWQRKLLDLSLRNSLLNFRKNKRAVTIEAPDPGKLEDTLAAGKALKILARPQLMDGSDPRSRGLHESRAQEDVHRQHALDGLSKGEIFAPTGEDELEATLIELYRSARTSLEEGGANTLFLAVGFLVWTQEGKELKKNRAPLVLIPVTLNRRSVRSGFTLTLHEDESQFNPTLLEMLHQDFQLHIDIVEGDLPKDDSGLDIRGIWGRVSEAIKDIKGWEVLPDVVLSTFSFAKYLMWKDLVHRTDQIRQNPVVRHLIDTPREPYQSAVRFLEARFLDREDDPRTTFCPLPADSSQLAAILSAARGKDFVLIGPPGTGKSQTISNLIAHCIASGKRVLFVAEKIAALEVVHRRLRKEGLGQFCLEIHSSKARKSAVLEALGTAWNSRGTEDTQTWETEARRLKDLRDRLNIYVEKLHHRHRNGLSIHEAVGDAVAGHDVPKVAFRWTSPSDHDVERLDLFTNIVKRLAIHSAGFGISELAQTPLRAVEQTEWDPLWRTHFLSSVEVVQSAAAEVLKTYRELANVSGLPSSVALTATGRAGVAEFTRRLAVCIGTNWSFVARGNASEVIADLRSAVIPLNEHRSVVTQIRDPWPLQVVAACRKVLELLHERETLRASLPAPWPASLIAELERGIGILRQLAQEESRFTVRYDISRISVSALEGEWRKAERAFWPRSVFAKRRIHASLRTAVIGGGEPDPLSDLPRLSTVEGLQAEVAGINLRALPPGIWLGLKTSIDVAEAALRLQLGLATISSKHRWAPESMDLVASGLCGAELKRTLDSIVRLAAIDTELDRFDWLRTETDGLWAGENTCPDALAAAANFCDDWRFAKSLAAHDLVRQGRCGDFLRTQYELLQRCRALETRIDSYAHLGEKTDDLWRGLGTELNEVELAIAFGADLERLVPRFASAAEVETCRSAIEKLCKSNVAAGVVQQAADAFHDASSHLDSVLATMTKNGRFSEEYKEQYQTAEAVDLGGKCQSLIDAGPRLQGWCSWVQARADSKSHGLDGLVTALEQGKSSPDALARTFEVNYSRWWLDHVVSGDEVLRTFVSAEHEKRIADFRALDDRYTALTRDMIHARLRTAIPSSESPVVGPEWGVLRHELTKKKRHLPLRELMGRIPSVVTTLTPCLLMSPLSIAQYLSISAAAFDLVVFDEASQITVWDAIGAIGRGKQVVMVGDPKQLPPTNFFNRADDEEDLPDDVPEDMESILDECIGAGLPSIQLDWHYRSRHESLIAFSNRRYYGGRLVTFPSPLTDDRAVSFHRCDGAYEKGGARTNPSEAKAVVRDLVACLKSEAVRHHDYSIGVVTFNAEQQKLIEDLLDAERRRDPSIEPYFGSDRIEPVFVKNLESVQGDERDIMYFSVTYGPDFTGRVSMNFGPMNREGGERRLNVAITRARRELRVFSSLLPEQIDLSRTQATGVSELKHFLEFAERGPRAFAEAVMSGSGEFESPLEQYIATALESRGWKIHTQVGVSNFRIDLGVVHPDAPGIYLAGVECDGATYQRAATARDRDKLRHQVLCGLGWEIFRVWSTDWWIDRRTTLDRLDAQLQVALEQSRKKRASKPDETPSETSETDVKELLEEGDSVTPGAETVESYDGNQNDGSVSATMGSAPEQFFERAYDSDLKRMVTEIIENEGPILDLVLVRRIARIHGWQRSGARIAQRVIQIASPLSRKTKENAGTFFWPRRLDAEQLIPFRPGLDRTVDEICMPELVSLALEVIASGDVGEGAVMAMARRVGLQRLRLASRRRLELALQRAEREARARGLLDSQL